MSTRSNIKEDGAIDPVRAGAAISPVACRSTRKAHAIRHRLPHITFTGRAAPARGYIEELLADVLDGTKLGKVFDRTIGLTEVPESYRAMADRDALKVLILP